MFYTSEAKWLIRKEPLFHSYNLTKTMTICNHQQSCQRVFLFSSDKNISLNKIHLKQFTNVSNKQMISGLIPGGDTSPFGVASCRASGVKIHQNMRHCLIWKLL